MTALDQPHRLAEELGEIEAFANGELDYDTPDTEMLFLRPRRRQVVRTPNGTTIRITKVDGWFFMNEESILVVHAKVLEAPQCPELVGEKVKIAVDSDGAIYLLSKS